MGICKSRQTGTSFDELVRHASISLKDGATLHREVPPERWCVTLQDLLQFRADVEQAILDGRITPTSSDSFDVLDRRHGPCMYTVNAQFIKPITACAGNVSWALMLHSEGLPCDLFVTHAWQEGIFEFIDKVTNSWPRGACAAYCCMLSNPQNLDIADLISTPRSSPFAKALMTSRSMLVVPNSKGSIYARLWCSYEVFLAYSWGKFVFTASAPVESLHITMASVLLIALPLASAGALLFGSGSRVVFDFATFCPAGFRCCLLLVMMFDRSYLLRAVNFVGAGLAGFWAGYHACVNIWIGAGVGTMLLFILEALIYLVVFMASEADRVFAEEARCEAKELLSDFTGRVSQAKCSNPEDGERIRTELAESGEEEDVDRAVAVLIRAGMSTPSLQEAAARGVQIDGVGHCKYSMACLGWWTWFYIGFKDHLKHVVPGSLAWLTCVPSLAWVGLMLSLSRDRRRFAYSAVGRIIVGGCYLPWVFFETTLSRLCLDKATRSNWLPVFEYSLVLIVAGGLGPLCIILSVAGPGASTRIPIVGPTLVRFIITLGCLNSLLGCCRRHSGSDFWGTRSKMEVVPTLLHEVELPARSDTLETATTTS